MASAGALSVGRSRPGRRLARSGDHACALTVPAGRDWERPPPPRPLPPPAHPDPGLAGDWPLLDFLEFGALPGAVPCARLHTRLVLREWRLPGLSDAAELAVSELMTNAVAASVSREAVLPVRLWLQAGRAPQQAGRARLLIMIWDSSEYPPLPAGAAPGAEGGRGLMLVGAVCARWDWFPAPQPPGKVVWALCER
jgi:anti-sigma regulatory factor (Ser/Thr protein kinase)